MKTRCCRVYADTVNYVIYYFFIIRHTECSNRCIEIVLKKVLTGLLSTLVTKFHYETDISKCQWGALQRIDAKEPTLAEQNRGTLTLGNEISNSFSTFPAFPANRPTDEPPYRHFSHGECD